MKKLEFKGQFQPNQLNSELLEAIPELKPAADNRAKIVITNTETELSLYVPDETDETQINQVVTAHHPSLEIQRNWQGLAIAFHSSHLYREHLREATKQAVSADCDQLWWTTQDIITVLANWVGDELSREAAMSHSLSTLFRTLKNAGFPVPTDDKAEILAALSSNGFLEIAAQIP